MKPALCRGFTAMVTTRLVAKRSHGRTAALTRACSASAAASVPGGASDPPAGTSAEASAAASAGASADAATAASGGGTESPRWRGRYEAVRLRPPLPSCSIVTTLGDLTSEAATGGGRGSCGRRAASWGHAAGREKMSKSSPRP